MTKIFPTIDVAPGNFREVQRLSSGCRRRRNEKKKVKIGARARENVDSTRHRATGTKDAGDGARTQGGARRNGRDVPEQESEVGAGARLPVGACTAGVSDSAIRRTRNREKDDGVGRRARGRVGRRDSRHAPAAHPSRDAAPPPPQGRDEVRREAEAALPASKTATPTTGNGAPVYDSDEERLRWRELRRGLVVGDWVLYEYIARGSFGQVWKALPRSVVAALGGVPRSRSAPPKHFSSQPSGRTRTSERRSK